MEQELNSYQRFLNGDQEGLCQIISTYKDGLILYLNSFLNDLSLSEELDDNDQLYTSLRRNTAL